MFFQGTIQEAVALAFEQGRPLACFVADDNEESSVWEGTYFVDEEIAPLLEQSVLVRLQAGSLEANFLAAFCPIQDVPYFTVIKNGTLVADVRTGATQGEFLTQLKAAFEENRNIISIPAPVAAVQSPVTPAQPVPRSPAPRRASSTAPDSSAGARNFSYLEQQRKRKQEENEERQRILKLLENDKREREARWKRRPEADSAPIAEPRTPKPQLTNETAISFRMLDGLSLKARFQSSAVLATDVRKWVDENRRDGDHPYNFLQILAPLPNKQITITEENSTLGDLGLSPTCTLVLVPTASPPASAYSGSGGGYIEGGVGILSRVYAMFYSIVTIILGVGYYPPVPAPPPTEPQDPQISPPPLSPPPAQPPSIASGPSSRIRTLYDRRASEEEEEEDHQRDRKYYNGNQLDFEPNQDETSHDDSG